MHKITYFNTSHEQVKENSVVLQLPDKTIRELPCGTVVWAAVSSPNETL